MVAFFSKRRTIGRVRKTAKRLMPRAYRRITGLIGPSRRQIQVAANQIMSELGRQTDRLMDAEIQQMNDHKEHITEDLLRQRVRQRFLEVQRSLEFDSASFMATKQIMDRMGIRQNRSVVLEAARTFLERIEFHTGQGAKATPVDFRAWKAIERLQQELGPDKAKKFSTLVARRYSVTSNTLKQEIDRLLRQEAELQEMLHDDLGQLIRAGFEQIRRDRNREKQ